jgi:hypothetical protein
MEAHNPAPRLDRLEVEVRFEENTIPSAIDSRDKSQTDSFRVAADE